MKKVERRLADGKPFIICAVSADSLRAELFKTRFGLGDALTRQIAYLAFGEPREGGIS